MSFWQKGFLKQDTKSETIKKMIGKSFKAKNICLSKDNLKEDEKSQTKNNYLQCM